MLFSTCFNHCVHSKSLLLVVSEIYLADSSRIHLPIHRTKREAQGSKYLVYYIRAGPWAPLRKPLTRCCWGNAGRKAYSVFRYAIRLSFSSALIASPMGGMALVPSLIKAR